MPQIGTDKHRFGLHPTIVTRRKQPFNPFYALLVIVGVTFTITACAYALMMVRATRPDRDYAAEFGLSKEGGLMKLLDERGMEIMGVEVLLLAVATVGAIGLDQWRGKREVRPGGPEGNSPGREAGDH
jgi:hypothetical protein